MRREAGAGQGGGGTEGEGARTGGHRTLATSSECGCTGGESLKVFRRQSPGADKDFRLARCVSGPRVELKEPGAMCSANPGRPAGQGHMPHWLDV